MTSRLRIGVLGTGNIAGRALIEPAKDVPDVVVDAVASRAVERAQAYATKHGIPRALTYEALIADPAIDIVYITLPPSMHAEWSIRALEEGKHVLCEKPMTANEAEAREVARVANRSDRVWMEAFHYPYHPFAKRVRDVLDTRVIGDIERVEAAFQIPGKYIAADNIRRRFALAGGALMDAGCYALHALRDILGDVKDVCEASAEVEPSDPQVDTGMRATLAFTGGREGRIHASFLAEDKPDVLITVSGSAGKLEVGSLYVPQWGGELRLEWNDRVYSEKADPRPSYFFQLQELVRCIRDGAPVLTSADDGVRNMAAIDAIYRLAGLKVRGDA